MDNRLDNGITLRYEPAERRMGAYATREYIKASGGGWVFQELIAPKLIDVSDKKAIRRIEMDFAGDIAPVLGFIGKQCKDLSDIGTILETGHSLEDKFVKRVKELMDNSEVNLKMAIKQVTGEFKSSTEPVETVATLPKVEELTADNLQITSYEVSQKSEEKKGFVQKFKELFSTVEGRTKLLLGSGILTTVVGTFFAGRASNEGNDQSAAIRAAQEFANAKPAMVQEAPAEVVQQMQEFKQAPVEKAEDFRQQREKMSHPVGDINNLVENNGKVEKGNLSEFLLSGDKSTVAEKQLFNEFTGDLDPDMHKRGHGFGVTENDIKAIRDQGEPLKLTEDGKSLTIVKVKDIGKSMADATDAYLAKDGKTGDEKERMDMFLGMVKEQGIVPVKPITEVGNLGDFWVRESYLDASGKEQFRWVFYAEKTEKPGNGLQITDNQRDSDQQVLFMTRLDKDGKTIRTMAMNLYWSPDKINSATDLQMAPMDMVEAKRLGEENRSGVGLERWHPEGYVAEAKINEDLTITVEVKTVEQVKLEEKEKDGTITPGEVVVLEDYRKGNNGKGQRVADGSPPGIAKQGKLQNDESPSGNVVIKPGEKGGYQSVGSSGGVTNETVVESSGNSSNNGSSGDQTENNDKGKSDEAPGKNKDKGKS